MNPSPFGAFAEGIAGGITRGVQGFTEAQRQGQLFRQQEEQRIHQQRLFDAQQTHQQRVFEAQQAERKWDQNFKFITQVASVAGQQPTEEAKMTFLNKHISPEVISQLPSNLQQLAKTLYAIPVTDMSALNNMALSYRDMIDAGNFTEANKILLNMRTTFGDKGKGLVDFLGNIGSGARKIQATQFAMQKVNEARTPGIDPNRARQLLYEAAGQPSLPDNVRSHIFGLLRDPKTVLKRVYGPDGRSIRYVPVPEATGITLGEGEFFDKPPQTRQVTKPVYMPDGTVRVISIQEGDAFTLPEGASLASPIEQARHTRITDVAKFDQSYKVVKDVMAVANKAPTVEERNRIIDKAFTPEVLQSLHQSATIIVNAARQLPIGNSNQLNDAIAQFYSKLDNGEFNQADRIAVEIAATFGKQGDPVSRMLIDISEAARETHEQLAKQPVDMTKVQQHDRDEELLTNVAKARDRFLSQEAWFAYFDKYITAEAIKAMSPGNQALAGSIRNLPGKPTPAPTPPPVDKITAAQMHNANAALLAKLRRDSDLFPTQEEWRAFLAKALPESVIAEMSPDQQAYARTLPYLPRKATPSPTPHGMTPKQKFDIDADFLRNLKAMHGRFTTQQEWLAHLDKVLTPQYLEGLHPTNRIFADSLRNLPVKPAPTPTPPRKDKGKTPTDTQRDAETAKRNESQLRDRIDKSSIAEVERRTGRPWRATPENIKLFNQIREQKLRHYGLKPIPTTPKASPEPEIIRILKENRNRQEK